MDRVLSIYPDHAEFNFKTVTITKNNPLRICVNAQQRKVGFYHLIITHGKAKKLDFGFRAGAQQIIELPPEWLNDGGEKDICFSLVLRNSIDTVTMKDDYKISPLKVERIDGNFVFADAVKQLFEMYDALEKRVAENEESIKTFALNGVDVKILEEDENEKID
jgi:hypothetical protein